jgi:hypothetical protein
VEVWKNVIFLHLERIDQQPVLGNYFTPDFVTGGHTRDWIGFIMRTVNNDD